MHCCGGDGGGVRPARRVTHPRLSTVPGREIRRDDRVSSMAAAAAPAPAGQPPAPAPLGGQRALATRRGGGALDLHVGWRQRPSRKQARGSSDAGGHHLPTQRAAPHGRSSRERCRSGPAFCSRGWASRQRIQVRLRCAKGEPPVITRPSYCRCKRKRTRRSVSCRTNCAYVLSRTVVGVCLLAVSKQPPRPGISS